MKDNHTNNLNSQWGRKTILRLADSIFHISTASLQHLSTILMRWGIYVCFFLSGATAIVFEVLWSRQFVTVFGNSSYAISVVLCAYMAGLGLGGLFGGRLADRITQRAAVYGLIQAIVAVWAMAIPPALDWFRMLVPALAVLSSDSLLVSTLGRFGLSFAILVVPCFLMGATLPLLVRVVTESDRFIGSRVGILYCLNTLGAALGCFAAGFWLVGTLGLHQINFVAVVVNFGIAIVAMALSVPMSRSAVSAPVVEPAVPKSEEALAGVTLLLTVAFLNGLAGLACEVLWIRYMAFLISSTYLFPTILCIYLLGLGLGGLIYGLLARWIRRPAMTLGIVEVLLALLVPAMFITGAIIFAGGPPHSLQQRGMAFITVFLPTVLMGVAFPLLCALYGRRVQTLGRNVGVLFAVNTAGTVVGSLLPVFVLVPMVGIQKSIMLISVLYGVMGFVLLACGKHRPVFVRAAVIYVVALLLFFIIVPSNLCQRVFLAADYYIARHTDILFYREGRTGTAVLTRDRINNCKTVYINGVSEVPLLYPHQLCFKMIGDLAPMLHPAPEDVLMICFGGGVASGATIQLPEVKSLTIVDLESSVVEAAKLLSQENNALLQNPKVRVVIDDGRNYITMARRKWPVIISDSTHPKSGDSWVLYTREFYQLVRDHLTDDGVFAEWVPTHMLHTDEFKIIVRTFQSVFPHASLWIIHGIDEQGRSGAYSLLAATPKPLKIDVGKLRDRLNAEPVRRDLEPFGLHTAAGFLDTFMCAEDSLRRWAGDGPVNTDDLPYTQYETRYSQGAILNNSHLVEPMEDIWPYLTSVGSEQEANNLREALALRARANRLALLGRLEEACAVLPDDARYRQMRRLYKDAPHYFQSLVSLYWDNPQVLSSLVDPLAIQPSDKTRVAIYERILKLDPKNAPALSVLGAMRVNAGLLQEGEDYLTRAVRLAPKSAVAHYNLGLCLAKEGRVAETVPWFGRAVELNPEFKEARLRLGLALWQTGRTQEAIPHLRYVLKVNPQDTMASDALAQIEGRSENASGQMGQTTSRPK